jgi:outer membrane lipoprotein carrier protein
MKKIQIVGILVSSLVISGPLSFFNPRALAEQQKLNTAGNKETKKSRERSPKKQKRNKKAVSGATPSAALAELEKLEKVYAQAGRVEADFRQEVYQAALARTKVSSGSITLSKPNLVKWETLQPERSVLVSDGRRVHYYSPDARGKDKGQVIVRPPRELEQQPIFRILTGRTPFQKEFALEGSHGEAGADTASPPSKRLVLVPKAPMGDLERLELSISDKYLILEMILHNKSGNRTKFTLQNQRLGDRLPPAVFAFTPPPGTEVLRP